MNFTGYFWKLYQRLSVKLNFFHHFLAVASYLHTNQKEEASILKW